MLKAIINAPSRVAPMSEMVSLRLSSGKRRSILLRSGLFVPDLPGFDLFCLAELGDALAESSDSSEFCRN